MHSTAAIHEINASITDSILAEANAHLKKHGWTQGAVAARFNITTSYVCRVLNGHMNSRTLLEKILTLGPNPQQKKKPTYPAPTRRAA